MSGSGGMMSLLALAVLAIGMEGCDSTTSPGTGTAEAVAPQGMAADALSPQSLVPFVVMGVSIEEGRQSNGTTPTSQQEAWPAQFARTAGITFSQPLFTGGCPPPSIAPLISGATAGPLNCDPLVPSAAVPANDVAITNSTTHDALFKTPEIAATEAPLRGIRYGRILGAGNTQVTAMLAQHPRLVAVDLGGAEASSAEFGDPNDITPYDDWRQDYDAIIEQVKGTGARGLLVWYTSDVALGAGERRGGEIWQDRAEFAAQGVTVPEECRTSGRDNLINVSDFLFQFIDAKVNGTDLPAVSCTDVPGTEDDVLTPSELATSRAMADRMLAHIRDLARANGYAVLTIDDAVHRLPQFKPQLSFTRLLYSSQPYGPLLSLDETHFNRRGHAILAAAAAKALSDAYGIQFEAASTNGRRAQEQREKAK